MIHIRNLQDCHLISHDPDLQREVTSYLLYCRYELLEYEDEEDIDAQDFNFQVLSAEDLPTLNDMLNDLGTAEEVVVINIFAAGNTQTLYRIVYPTEVFFIPAEISDQFSF